MIARPIRARLVTLVAALALAAVALPSTAFAGDGSERLPGFTGKRSAEQLELEKRFKRAVSARRAGEISRTLSGRPQLIGSPGLADSLAFSLERLSSYGLDAGTAPYEVYISIWEPNSTTRSGGRQKYAVALDALRDMKAKSFSRQIIMPGCLPAITVSRPRKNVVSSMSKTKPYCGSRFSNTFGTSGSSMKP